MDEGNAPSFLRDLAALVKGWLLGNVLREPTLWERSAGKELNYGPISRLAPPCGQGRVTLRAPGLAAVAVYQRVQVNLQRILVNLRGERLDQRGIETQRSAPSTVQSSKVEFFGKHFKVNLCLIAEVDQVWPQIPATRQVVYSKR